jgi:hypothetical protein
VPADSGAWSTHALVEWLLELGLKPTAQDREALLGEIEALRSRVEALLEREAQR